MSDLIDRNELLERFYCEKDVSSTLWGIDGIENLLLNAPAVQAKPVVHGEWVEYEVPHIICCSECDWGTSIDEKGFKFCPNCGADMRGGKNE